jgi:hypothetical protein
MEKRGQYKKNSFGIFWFLLNLIIGLYFLNLGLKFVELTFISDSIKNVIMIIGGALIIIGGFMAMRRSSVPVYR